MIQVIFAILFVVRADAAQTAHRVPLLMSTSVADHFGAGRSFVSRAPPVSRSTPPTEMLLDLLGSLALRTF